MFMNGRASATIAVPARRRVRRKVWAMTARCSTALFGGYAAAAVLATLLARTLPIARVEATGWGMILSFLLFATIGLWSFHEPRLARVAGAVWGIVLVGGGVLRLLGVRP